MVARKRPGPEVVIVAAIGFSPVVKFAVLNTGKSVMASAAPPVKSISTLPQVT